MKYASILLLCTGFAAVHSAQNIDPISQVNLVQTSLDAIIAQADLDPIIAQALTDEINSITQEATANIQQDMQDIRIAAAFTTLLEAAQNLAKTNPSLMPFKSFIQSLKYSSHINVVQKLLS